MPFYVHAKRGALNGASTRDREVLMLEKSTRSRFSPSDAFKGDGSGRMNSASLHENMEPGDSFSMIFLVVFVFNLLFLIFFREVA